MWTKGWLLQFYALQPGINERQLARNWGGGDVQNRGVAPPPPRDQSNNSGKRAYIGAKEKFNHQRGSWWQTHTGCFAHTKKGSRNRNDEEEPVAKKPQVAKLESMRGA